MTDQLPPSSSVPNPDRFAAELSSSSAPGGGEGQAGARPTAEELPRGSGLARRIGRRFLDAYATVDTRSLGVFRILLGSLLFVDLARRYPDLLDHFTNEGWLSNHFALFRPMGEHHWSLYHAFSTPGEVKVLFFAHLAVYFLFLVGWRTKLMHFLAVILLVSIKSRTVLAENGGWIVLIIVTVWSLFLPLGQRFSLDSLLRSFKTNRDVSQEALNDPAWLPVYRTRVVSLAATALLVQWAVIYYFNAVHKNGAHWLDGSAVYYFLQQDRMVTPFGGWVREFLPPGLIKVMTYGALAIEYVLPLLLLTPFFIRAARLVAWALIIALHLSIDLLVQLGPFSWAMMVMLAAFIHRDDWEWLKRRQRKKRAPRVVYYNAENGVALQVCRFIKRFDGHHLVEFRAEPGLLSGLEVGPGGAAGGEGEPSAQREAGRRGLLELSRALSLPRVFWAWLSVPGFAQAFDWFWGRLLKLGGSAAEWLGLNELPEAQDIPANPEPSGLQRLSARVQHWFAQLAVLVLLVAATSQVLIENRAVPKALKPENRPKWMTALVMYPRMFQGWSMFAPQPPDQDGYVMVDALTEDGRRVDPLNGGTPNFGMNPKGGRGMNQIWGDFQRRVAEGRFSAFLPGIKTYIMKYHERTGNPKDRIVAFQMWNLTENVTPQGQEPAVPKRKLILEHGKLSNPTPWPWEGAEKRATPSPPQERP